MAKIHTLITKNVLIWFMWPKKEFQKRNSFYFEGFNNKGRSWDGWLSGARWNFPPHISKKQGYREENVFNKTSSLYFRIAQAKMGFKWKHFVLGWLSDLLIHKEKSMRLPSPWCKLTYIFLICKKNLRDSVLIVKHFLNCREFEIGGFTIRNIHNLICLSEPAHTTKITST